MLGLGFDTRTQGCRSPLASPRSPVYTGARCFLRSTLRDPAIPPSTTCSRDRRHAMRRRGRWHRRYGRKYPGRKHRRNRWRHHRMRGPLGLSGRGNRMPRAHLRGGCVRNAEPRDRNGPGEPSERGLHAKSMRRPGFRQDRSVGDRRRGGRQRLHGEHLRWRDAESRASGLRDSVQRHRGVRQRRNLRELHAGANQVQRQ